MRLRLAAGLDRHFHRMWIGKKTSVTLTRHLISSSVLPCFRDVIIIFWITSQMVQLIPLYVWSRSITGSISLGALFFFQMVRDAQDPKRRWPSIVTELNSVLSHVVQPICFEFLIIVFSQQRKVLRLWCQELPVKTFWKVVTLRGMVSTGLTQQPQGTPLECIVTWLLMEVSSNPPFLSNRLISI